MNTNFNMRMNMHEQSENRASTMAEQIEREQHEMRGERVFEHHITVKSGSAAYNGAELKTTE